ncbi:hypothetical protein [Streptomyces sp. NPDC005548]|uniref:hypothetical protein n=1 Tax=Streptomyces sp. NPDC005548 TaxID=3364724 RepID=UPI0036810CA7
MTNAEYAYLPACNAEANQRLMHGIDLKRDWLYATTRAAEVDNTVKRDPRLRAAWEGIHPLSRPRRGIHGRRLAAGQ